MPKPTLPDRVEALERKLRAMEQEETQESGTEAARILDRGSGAAPPARPSFLQQKGSAAADSARGLVGRTIQQATGGLVNGSSVTNALRGAGTVATAGALATAAVTAAPLALEAIGQLTGNPALQRAAGALGDVLPVQRVRAEVAGAQAALGTALAFGRAGVGLTADQLGAGQAQARQLAQREAEVDRRRNVAAIRRNAAALGETLGAFDPGAPEGAGGREGGGTGLLPGRARVEADLEAAAGRVGSLFGREEEGRRVGRAVESAAVSPAGGAILGGLDPFGFRGLLSGEADEPRKLDPMKARRIQGLGTR